MSHSSSVKLHLVVGEVILDLSHAGPMRVVLKNPQRVPSGPAEVIMLIDGHQRKWPVVIVKATQGSSTDVEIVDRN